MNKDKFDEIVLAMLWYNGQAAGSSWKSFDWEATNRLFEAGLISNPKSSRKSVDLSETGEARAKAAFRKHFGEPE